MAVSAALRIADTRLRALLENVYDSRESIVFEDVLAQFKKCVTFEFDCILYIKERRWFNDLGKEEPNGELKFSYLAFKLEAQHVSRFQSRSSLEREEILAQQNGYNKDDGRLITIWYKSPHRSQDLKRILNLAKRIFVGFYRNCGAYDHFRESVSRRFVSDFYRQMSRPLTLELVTQYINSLCDIDVSLWNQKDEMFFHQEARPAELLSHITSSGVNHSVLFDNHQFELDLKTSVTRKNQTYGKSQNPEVYYVIRTFSDNYFIGEVEHFNFKTQQRAVAIYSKAGKPISLDAVAHANRLIDIFLRTAQETQYHSIILRGTHECALREEELSTDPVSTRDELWAEFRRILDPLLIEVARHTRAEFVCMRLYEPFSEALVPIAVGSADNRSVRDVVDVRVVGNDTSASAEAFKRDEMLDLWHPLKLSQDIAEGRREGWQAKTRDLELSYKRRMQLQDSRGRADAAVVAIPIRKGNFLIGTIEFCSSEASRLSYETRFFELVASICGDIIRRIELANDRGWLARMSFVHAARHRIEAILRDIRADNREVAEQLVHVIQTGTVVKPPTAAGARFTRMMESLSQMLRPHGEQASENILATLQMIADVCGIPDRACDSLLEIFETLLANSSHSRFSLNELSLDFTENAVSANALRIRYAPRDVAVQIERLERLCVSPIPDDKTVTFHYGLFLLSCQIRMVGGIAVSRPVEEDSLGGTPFGVSFLIPLGGS